MWSPAWRIPLPGSYLFGSIRSLFRVSAVRPTHQLIPGKAFGGSAVRAFPTNCRTLERLSCRTIFLEVLTRHAEDEESG